VPVVIDEFQVVAEPPTGERPAAAAPAEPAPPAAPPPRDVERAFERRVVRLTRVRAH
jgi:hypothetical protein